jgi:hypothetical protein
MSTTGRIKFDLRLVLDVGTMALLGFCKLQARAVVAHENQVV